MKTHYDSLDFLRGLGIFFVLALHTAFYFYNDIYDVDINNPSPVITLIGFLLMFAGLFAMISAVSYTTQYLKANTDEKKHQRFKHMLLSGALLLMVAYLYFLFTGPGIIHFDTRSMDESIFISLINQGSIQKLTIERLFYVDSLVMLALNIFLMAFFFKAIKKYFDHKNLDSYILIFAITFMAFSYIRIPLYNVYLNAVDDKNFFLMSLLNWFVGKNNPILPFFAFALFGVWVGVLLKKFDPKTIKRKMLPVIITTIIIGVTGYILTPETMLERAIDPTWYFIMVIQIGLFLGMILMGLNVFDFKDKKDNTVTRFFSRFGVAGLTPFFFEQIMSALIFLFINQFIKLELGISGAILYGFILAITWGLFLIFWEKRQYKYGLEWAISSIVNKISPSSKKIKLAGDLNGND